MQLSIRLSIASLRIELIAPIDAQVYQMIIRALI
jgi:hypothetical protein